MEALVSFYPRRWFLIDSCSYNCEPIPAHLCTSSVATPLRHQETSLRRRRSTPPSPVLLTLSPPDKTFIVCGDFNAILTERMSHMSFLPEFPPGESAQVAQNTELFTEFLLSRNLRPANLYLTPRRNAKLHTYFGPNKRQVCLDYILVPTRWIRSIRSSSVNLRTRPVASDHKAVVTNFKLRIRRPRRHPSAFSLFD